MQNSKLCGSTFSLGFGLNPNCQVSTIGLRVQLLCSGVFLGYYQWLQCQYDGSHVILYGHAQALPSYFLVQRNRIQFEQQKFKFVNLIFKNGIPRLGYLVYQVNN